jgi:prephenate dehydrogenase
MTIQLTILGLGQIGASVGMALSKHKDSIVRVGHDKSREAVSFAKDNNVVDRTALTLSGAVKDADIVLLALPFHEIRSVLEFIGPDLKQDVLVMDTAPLKNPVISWVKEYLPEGTNYVGLVPVIKADYLVETEFGPETAHDDLFNGSLMAVVTDQTASDKAINMAANFVQLLGAAPYFADAAEIDGLMSMTHLLPQLLASVMLDISQNAPGWREGRKFAGKAYSQMTNSFGKDEISGALAAALSYNQENFNRLINDMIRKLVEIRDMEAPEGNELAEAFQALQQSRDIWLNERQDNPWIDAQKTKIPAREGVLSRLLGFRGPKPSREDE